MNVEAGPKRLFIAEPRGLCAGVVRSLEAFDQALDQNPGQVLYSVGEPAHNTHINNRYKDMGVRFVASIDEVPLEGKALLGPHGTEVEQIQQAKDRGLTVWDTTCPLVTKVEEEIKRYTALGLVTIYWGDPDHQEAKSAMSAGDVILVTSQDEALSDKTFDKTNGRGVAFASQTTFNVDEAKDTEGKLKVRYPNLVLPVKPDRCYATRNRQAAVKEMIVHGAKYVVIVGSPGSSNSKRLYEVALENGAGAAFVDSADELNVESLRMHEIVGFESGASVEEDVFQSVVEKVESRYGSQRVPIVATDPTDKDRIVQLDESRIRFVPVRVTDYKLPEFIYQS